MAAKPTKEPARGFEKSSASCPTRQTFAERLSGGKIRQADAVIVWDVTTGYENVSIDVGLLPAGAFRGMPADAPERTRWLFWMRQWHEHHGGGMTPEWMSTPKETPEGLLADWISRGRIRRFDIDPTLARLEKAIEGFSSTRVKELQKQFEKEEDEAFDEDED